MGTFEGSWHLRTAKFRVGILQAGGEYGGGLLSDNELADNYK
jgi:hypothetical protein